LYVFDTDHISILQLGEGIEYERLTDRNRQSNDIAEPHTVDYSKVPSLAFQDWLVSKVR